MREARSAGTDPATPATIPNTTTAAASDSGSLGATPNKVALSNRAPVNRFPFESVQVGRIVAEHFKSIAADERS